VVKGGVSRLRPRPWLLAGVAGFVLVLIGIRLAARYFARDPRTDPCDGVYMGAALSGSYLDMSLTLSFLEALERSGKP
jgi:hypothetical protein